MELIPCSDARGSRAELYKSIPSSVLYYAADYGMDETRAGALAAERWEETDCNREPANRIYGVCERGCYCGDRDAEAGDEPGSVLYEGAQTVMDSRFLLARGCSVVTKNRETYLNESHNINWKRFDNFWQLAEKLLAIHETQTWRNTRTTLSMPGPVVPRTKTFPGAGNRSAS